MAAQHQRPQRHRQQVGDRVLQGVRVQGRQPHLASGDIKLNYRLKMYEVGPNKKSVLHPSVSKILSASAHENLMNTFHTLKIFFAPQKYFLYLSQLSNIFSVSPEQSTRGGSCGRVCRGRRCGGRGGSSRSRPPPPGRRPGARPGAGAGAAGVCNRSRHGSKV